MSIPQVTPSDFCQRQYDYIVVGGGTAGLAVAARLSENPDITVGVVEAGPAAFNDPIIDVPGRFGENLNTRYDWQFETTPQSGLADRKLPWARGKVLGGTSALNFMTWNRASREDYDAWEQLGNAGWGWESLLPFFKKCETLHQPTAEHQEQHQSHVDAGFHGTNGPLQTVHSKEYSATHKYWHDTLNKLDIQTNRSHFSGSNVGVWTNVTSVEPITRTRSYAATAYYLPNLSRQNLVLLTNALAREVLLEEEEGTWVTKGIRFTQGGEEHIARISREVIVSAGSVQSPQLLELSGIGNPAILKRAGVAVKVENPNVGEHLQEHMMTSTIYEIDPSIATPNDLRRDPKLAQEADVVYAASQSGPRAIVPSSMCYLPLSHFLAPEELAAFAARATPPDAARTPRDDILLQRFSPDTKVGQIEYIFDVGNWSTVFQDAPGKKYGTMLQILQHPFSIGSIHIPPQTSSGPTTAEDKPVIDPKYYGSEGGRVDFDIMAACQEYGFKICQTAPLSNVIIGRVFPAPEEDLVSWLRQYTITDWHPVGTCSMGGNAGIKGGVVDERLRVYGVEGLRVIDASIMPIQISGHSQATIYAIAEKGASMILEDRSQ